MVGEMENGPAGTTEGSPGGGAAAPRETSGVEPAEPGKDAASTSTGGSRVKAILEALIFVSESPLSLERMAGVLPDCPRKALRESLAELVREYEEKRDGALEIVQVAGGYQVRTRPEFGPWIGKLRQQRFTRLSRAALETLAIIAYRQPVTRAEIESIRGVDAGGVLGTLLERRLLRILGRKEVPGRPILYGTTQEFLELFGLKSLKELPTLREIEGMFRDEEEREEPGEGSAGEDRGGETDAASDDGARGTGDVAAAREDEGGPEAGVVEEGSTGGDGIFEDEPIGQGEESAPGEEEISPAELDEILRSTKVRLRHFEEEMAREEGGREVAGGAEGNGEEGGPAGDDLEEGKGD